MPRKRTLSWLRDVERQQIAAAGDASEQVLRMQEIVTKGSPWKQFDTVWRQRLAYQGVSENRVFGNMFKKGQIAGSPKAAGAKAENFVDQVKRASSELSERTGSVVSQQEQQRVSGKVLKEIIPDSPGTAPKTYQVRLQEFADGAPRQADDLYDLINPLQKQGSFVD